MIPLKIHASLTASAGRSNIINSRSLMKVDASSILGRHFVLSCAVLMKGSAPRSARVPISPEFQALLSSLSCKHRKHAPLHISVVSA